MNNWTFSEVRWFCLRDYPIIAQTAFISDGALILWTMLPSSQQPKPSSRGGQASSDRTVGDSAARRSEHDTSLTARKSADVSTTISVPAIVSGAANTPVVSNIKKIVCNELLTYIFHYRNNSVTTALYEVVSNHFSAEDVAEAKRLLVNEFQGVTGAGQFLTERRNSQARTAREAELEDIVGILQVADAEPSQLLDGYLFVASDIKRLPKYGPEEVNIAVVVDRQIRMEASIHNLSTAVQQMASSAGSVQSSDDVVRQAVDIVSTDVKRQMSDMRSETGARLDHLTAVCSQLAQNVQDITDRYKQSPPPRPIAAARVIPDARAQNLIMFGVPEDKSAAVWRKTVDDALRFINDKDVDITDLFRIGRFAEGKVRPIVIKLRTAWDKRIILLNCKKLKDFPVKKLFVTADEPVETRRQRALERLKLRAERDGKATEVRDGILSIDGVQVFSLSAGKLV